MNGEVKRSKNLSELPMEIQNLCQHSLEARKAAYAPYSQFLVGAALLAANGTLIQYVNIYYVLQGHPKQTVILRSLLLHQVAQIFCKRTAKNNTLKLQILK